LFFESWVAEGSLQPLEPWCKKKNVEHVRQFVSKLSLSEATLDNGETIPFDVCVITTGATTEWSGLGRGLPSDDGSRESRLKKLEDVGKKFLNADSVLVIGGGLIGTELAGDIGGYSKKAGTPTKVTLVHSGDHLCPEMVGNKAPQTVKKQLEKNGVRVVLNEKAVEKDGKYVLSKSGEVIEAEEVVMTTGIQPITGFMKEGGLDKLLTEEGWIETDEYFKVKGTNNKIFSFGDSCTTLPNSAVHLLENIAIIGFNIKASLDGSSKLKKFATAPTAIIATTGPATGVMYGGKGFYTKRMLPFFKNKTMFHFRVKGLLDF